MARPPAALLLLLLLAQPLALLAAGAPSPGAEVSRVLLLRHCPRAPYSSDRHPPASPDGFAHADNFSAAPFPADWGVADGQCTSAGLHSARGVGGALRAVLGLGDGDRAEVVADSVARCEATAAALGLGARVAVDQALFDPLSARLPGCGQPDWDAAVRAQVAGEAAALARARARLPELQELLGRGAARPLAEIPDEVLGGYLVGGLRVASELVVETFVLEKTSAKPVGWGRVSDEGLRGFLEVRSAYFRAMYGGEEIAQRYASGILAALDDLARSGGAAPKVLVGHDLNVQGVGSLLGLSWRCGPWAENSTEPLSGLLFERSGPEVRVRAVCPTLDGSAPVAVGQARFPGGLDTMPTEEFSRMVRGRVAWQCVNRTAAGGPPWPEESLTI